MICFDVSAIRKNPLTYFDYMVAKQFIDNRFNAAF